MSMCVVFVRNSDDANSDNINNSLLTHFKPIFNKPTKAKLEFMS